MQYTLHSYLSYYSLPISSDEFEALKTSKAGLDQVLSVERIFDAVMENYVEHEETVMSLGTRQLAFHSHSYIDLQLMRELVSRRILNFLSSGRLYRGTLGRHAKKLLDTSDYNKIRSALTDGPHQPMEYRIISALRDFAQHEDLPLSSISVSRRWEEFDEEDKKELAAIAVIPKIDTRRLANRSRLPADVRIALNAMDEKEDVRNHIRKYVEYLGSIHVLFRELMEKQSEAWESTIRRAMTHYREGIEGKDKAKKVDVTAQRLGEKGDVERVPLFDNYFEYLKYLTRKNHSQVNLSKRYVQWQSKEQTVKRGKPKKS